MARTPRLFVPGGTYHVYCRTARGERIFEDPEEAEAFLEVVASVKRRHGFRLLAWCLMGNHYHLVVRTGEIPLWRTMARIQCRTARAFNRPHGFLGRLWQSRYKARFVDENRYLLQLLAYVHLNPVTAGLTDDPIEHRWSGHAALVGRGRPVLVDVADALACFDTSWGGARRRYLAHVRAVAEERWWREGLRDLPWWSTATCDEEIVDVPSRAAAVDHLGTPQPETRRESIASLCKIVAIQLTVSEQEIRGPGRSPAVARARRRLTVLAVESHGHPVGAVAAFLGKHPGSVSRWLAESSNRL